MGDEIRTDKKIRAMKEASLPIVLDIRRHDIILWAEVRLSFANRRVVLVPVLQFCNSLAKASRAELRFLTSRIAELHAGTRCRELQSWEGGSGIIELGETAVI